MAGAVLVTVLMAAILHAVWNAMAKAVPDHRVTAGPVGVMLISLALNALAFADGPPKAAAGLGLAGVAGALVAAYTLIDGWGSASRVMHSAMPPGESCWRDSWSLPQAG